MDSHAARTSVRAIGARGKAADETARIGIPPRCAQAAKRRNKVATVVAGQRAGYRGGFSRVGDDAELIAQPLDGAARMENGALQRIANLAVFRDADGGQQPVLGMHNLVARIHEHEAAGAVGVLGLPGLEAAMAKERRLLIAGNAVMGGRVRHDLA